MPAACRATAQAGSGPGARLCSRDTLGSILTAKGSPVLTGPRCALFPKSRGSAVLMGPCCRSSHRPGSRLSMWDSIVLHPQSPRTHLCTGDPVVPHLTDKCLSCACGTHLTPILTASEDAWPSRAPQVSTGAQELCPVIQQWAWASELGKVLGSMRRPHTERERRCRSGGGLEKKFAVLFLLLGATELEIRFDLLGGNSGSWGGQAEPPIPADHAALLPAVASFCRDRCPGGHHGMSAVFSACFRARREQGPLQGSFGMRGSDLCLGHQQRPRSR